MAKRRWSLFEVAAMKAQRKHSCDPLEGIEQDVALYGWRVLNVENRFLYTIGLSFHFAHPELLLAGLPPLTAYEFLQRQSARVMLAREDDPIVPDIVDDSVATAPSMFKRVDRKFYDDYVGSAIRFYGHEEFKVLQLVWCDRSGRFPWQPGFDATLKPYQPLLFDTKELT